LLRIQVFAIIDYLEGDTIKLLIDIAMLMILVAVIALSTIHVVGGKAQVKL
jgi:succinate dehydrogenase hydrophobic anchor subunit